MIQRRRIKITSIEKRRVVVGPRVLLFPCPVCGLDVETVSEAEAADFLSLSVCGVAAVARTGRVHAMVTASGSLRICKRSLLGDSASSAS